MAAVSWSLPPWLRVVSGTSQQFSFEERLFNALSMIISVLAWMYLVFQICIPTRLANLGPTLVIGIVFSYCFVQSRFSDKYLQARNVSMVAVALLILPSWFSGGGAQDPSRFMGLPFYVLYLICYKRASVWSHILFWTLSITACLIAEARYPLLANPLHPATTGILLKSWVTHFMTFLVLGFMIRAFVVAYDQEQQRSLALMGELRQSRDEAEVAREQAVQAKLTTEEALEQVKKAHLKLEEANQFKEKLMFMVTHDLRGPLTGLMFGAEMMGRKQLKEAQLQEIASMIAIQTQTLNELLEDLMSFQYVEKGKDILNPMSFDLRDWTEQIQIAWTERASTKHITIDMHQELQTTQWNTDKLVLQQILDNLVSNAIKYSQPDTTVGIEVSSTANEMTLKISDQGPGFSEEDKKKMYGRFQKLSARPTGGESSMGLGLSIVADLVELLEGSIDCNTAPGKGSTFTVRLPMSVTRETSQENQ